MSVKWEKTGASTGTLEFTITKEKIKTGLDAAFNKARQNISVPGFRKGKISRQVFNSMYGESALFEDALNEVLPEVYSKAVDEAGIDPVGRPDIDVKSMEEGQDWEIVATVPVKPEVTLGQYKELDVTKQERNVSDEEVDANLESKREQHAEMVLKESAAENGDTVVIDYEGSVDGVPFDGGKAENHSLELGSNSFIPGFESGLVGVEPGEERDVTVTFPEEYQAEELAGKEAVFKVKVHEIKAKALPELDDEFAKDIDEEVDTLAELKEKVRKQLEEGREAAATEAVEDEAIRKAVENAEIEDIPGDMIHDETHRQMDVFLNNMEKQGISPELYYQLTGTKEADLHKQMEGEAEFRVRTNLVLEAIVEEEKVDATEEEITEEVKSLAQEYGMEESAVRGVLSKDMLIHDIRLKKAIDLITTSAKETLEPETDATEEK